MNIAGKIWGLKIKEKPHWLPETNRLSLTFRDSGHLLKLYMFPTSLLSLETWYFYESSISIAVIVSKSLKMMSFQRNLQFTEHDNVIRGKSGQRVTGFEIRRLFLLVFSQKECSHWRVVRGMCIVLIKNLFVPLKFCSFSTYWLPQMFQNIDRKFCWLRCKRTSS
jgi:hypothetical protein